MPLLSLSKDARDFISNLNDVKRHRQVTNKLLALTAEAFPADAEALQSEEFSGYYRADIGEYRILYGYVEETDIVSVYVIGKRDGEEAYKEFKRKLKSM